MVLAAVLVWLSWTVWALTGSTLEQRWLAPIELTPQVGEWRIAAGSGDSGPVQKRSSALIRLSVLLRLMPIGIGGTIFIFCPLSTQVCPVAPGPYSR